MSGLGPALVVIPVIFCEGTWGCGIDMGFTGGGVAFAVGFGGAFAAGCGGGEGDFEICCTGVNFMVDLIGCETGLEGAGGGADLGCAAVAVGLGGTGFEDADFGNGFDGVVGCVEAAVFFVDKSRT